MKLQNEIDFAVTKVDQFIQRNGIEKVKSYMLDVYNSKDYKNFDVRISNDIIKGVLGIRYICDMYDKYKCNDQHITTFAIAVMKKANLLPFCPSQITD